MSDLTPAAVHVDDTYRLAATLPPDLSQATSVTVRLTRNGTVETASADIEDAAAGTVSVALDAVGLAVGYWTLQYEIEFADGSVEVIEAAGDTLRVYGGDA
jgi:hypothetical protein